MTSLEKHKYAYALTSVASAGLSFIEDSLSRVMNNAKESIATEYYFLF